MSVVEIDGLLYLKDHPEDQLRRALRIPALSPGWKVSFSDLLNAAAGGTAQSPAWSGFRPFMVRRTRMECEDVRSFELSPQDDSAIPAFLPGQHIAVRLHPAASEFPLLRTYSLCGPQEASFLRIAVKRDAGGAAGIYMHEQVVEGTVLEISAPRGVFTLSEGKGPLALLSAGIGVTPVLSMLYQVVHQDPHRQVWWLHSCRSGAHEAFWGQVRCLGMRLTAFHRAITYSSPRDTDICHIDYDIRGHLDLEKLREMQLPAESECYLCGPPAYLRDMTDALKNLGFTGEKIKSELFGSAPPSSGKEGKIPHLPLENDGQGPLVTFSKSKVSFRWHSRFGSLLAAAEACDVPVQWSCRMGVCHHCETALIGGEVNYLPDPPDPPADGSVLLCCSVPLSPVDLDL